MNSLHNESVQLEQLMPLIREKLNAGNSVLFSPNGVSMLPLLRQGIDSVVLSPIPQQLKKYDLILYQRDNGQYLLHRIIKTGTLYTCVGDNQYYPDTNVHKDQIIALVRVFYRADKKVSVDSFIYQCYCRIWHYSRPFRHFFVRGFRWLRRRI